MENHPNSIVAVQFHMNDAYDIPFSYTRGTFYGIVGVPTTWFDGVIERVNIQPSESQTYTWFEDAMNARLGVPTDVTIDAAVERVGFRQYRVAATIAVEPGGVDKDMVVHFLQVLDHYPSSADNRYRNAARAHAEAAETVPAGGAKLVYSDVFALDDVDWQHHDQARFVVWVQQPAAFGPAEVYQATVVDLPPYVEGDADGDGDVDLADLAILLGAYGTCQGDAGYDGRADFNGDECVDLVDLALMLGNYGT